MNTQSIQNFYNRKFDTLVTVLYIIAAIFLLAGIFIPGAMISDFGQIISRNPEVLIFPLYIGLLLIAFAGLSYAIAVVLKQPSDETVWIENTMTTIGTILIIIGVIAFIIANSNDAPISELRKLGVAGGVLLLLFHLKIGLLCIGAASLHNKYNAGKVSSNITTEDSSKKVVYCTSCGKQVEIEPGDKMCYHCGGHL